MDLLPGNFMIIKDTDPKFTKGEASSTGKLSYSYVRNILFFFWKNKTFLLSFP